MTKLIAFFSRADENYFGGAYRYITVGNTEKAARMIAAATGGELFKIEQKIPYAADHETCIVEAKRNIQRQARPGLAAWLANLDGYDEIYLGYPNYWGTMPMAVYTFLEAFDWAGKIIHPFCTHEGSGLSKTEQDIVKAAKGAKVTSGLAICGSNVDPAKSKIESWCKSW